MLVLDTLNTHGPHSLYETFDPVTARRLAEKIEWHFTPRHGSRLNMAEIELSIFSRQCLLGEHMGSQERLTSEVAAWQERWSAAKSWVDWQFTTADACGKLKRFYPKLLTS